jgi:hypothetical protein
MIQTLAHSMVCLWIPEMAKPIPNSDGYDDGQWWNNGPGMGTSPSTLSARFNSEIGNVIPTFSVLSDTVVPTILVLYIVPNEL